MVLKEKFANDIVYLKNKGSGPGVARNLGIEVSSGNYIKFFDSDDLMTDKTLEIQSHALSNSPKGFIYGPYLKAYQNNKNEWITIDNEIIQFHPFPDHKSIHYWMCRGLFIPIPGMMFKKEILKDAGKWNESVLAYEDWDYLWRLGLIESNPLHSNECAFLYRVHGNQTTEAHFSNAERDKQKILIFKNIIKNLFPNNLNNWDLKNLEFKINHLDPSMKKQKDLREALTDKLVYYYLRILDKKGRIKTKTNWQVHYGPLRNVNVVMNFLNSISYK